jgi:hypothetical protein
MLMLVVTHTTHYDVYGLFCSLAFLGLCLPNFCCTASAKTRIYVKIKM